MMIALGPVMRRVSRSFSDGGLQMRHLTQIGHLLSGNAMSSLLMLISTAIAARAMTTEKFGIFVMVLTFVRLVERIARFESWQPLIKFATDAEVDGDRDRLARLYLYGLLLDIAAALVAALAALALVALFGPLIGIPDGYLELVAICCVGTLFNITGMPTAALRLAGQFRTIAYSQLVAQVLRIVLAVICWWRALGVESFLIAWTAAQIFGAMIFLAFGFAALKAQSVPNPLLASPRHLRRDFPGFLSFASSTNLSMTMRTLTQEADTLLVGALAGASPAGFYHIAKRLAKLAQQVGAQAQAVMYPDMARLWAGGKFAELRLITLRIQRILGIIGLAVLIAVTLFGETLVTLAVGSKYDDIGPLLIAQVISVIFIMHTAPSRSVLLSMGRPQLVLCVAGLGTAIFFATAVFLIPSLGAMGASIAQIAFAGFTAAWMDIAWRRTLHRLADGEGYAPPDRN